MNGQSLRAIYLFGYRRLGPVLRSFASNFDLFDDIQTLVFQFNAPYSVKYRQAIRRKFQNVSFVELFPEVPAGIDESELFWNRSSNYAKSFGPERLGYLHMCWLAADVGNLPLVNDYSMALQIDDDTSLTRPLPIDIFAEVESSPGFFGTSSTYSHVNDNHLASRENIFRFTKNYVGHYKIDPQNTEMKNCLIANDEDAFHRLEWTSCNFNVYQMAEFKTDRWRHWITAVKEFGGSYKYRWGDQEIIGIYGYLYFEKPFINFSLESQGVVVPKRRSANVIRVGRSIFTRLTRV